MHINAHVITVMDMSSVELLPESQPLKTIEQVNAEFENSGVSKRAWAKKHGVQASALYEFLGGRHKGMRGESHKIAVLLGTKRGVIPE